MENYNIKLSKILYHWQLSMALFRFCETCLLHIKPFVVNKSAIIPFLGGMKQSSVQSTSSYLIFTTGLRPKKNTWMSFLDSLGMGLHRPGRVQLWMHMEALITVDLTTAGKLLLVP